MSLKIAHRGLSHNFKDNSRIAFEKAIEHNFDMIELDIQLCKDNEIVVYHDIYYKNKYINEYTGEQLKKMDFLLLDDFFDTVKDSSIKIFFDLKGSEEVFTKLIEQLEIRKDIDYTNIYISSFNCLFNNKIQNCQLPIKRGLTTETLFDVNKFASLTEGLDFVCLHWTTLHKDIVQYCKNKNILVFSYTVKDNFILNHMRKFHVDGIVSNYFFE
jgi:glycerophosphoryl diester phosphodiesterase